MRFLILLFSAFAAFAQQNLSSPTTVLDPASGASKLVLGNQYVQANGINTAGGMLDFRAITYSPSPGSTCYDEYGNLVSQPTVDIPPPAWVSTVTYASGATATLGTTIYKSVQAANLNHSPDTSPTWWRATGPATVFLAPNYNAGTTYAVNDQVNYGNTIYQSLQSANAGNTPSSSPTWWQPLGTAAADVLMWNSTSPLQGYAAPFTMVGGQPAFLTGTPCAPPVPVITGLPYGINLNSYIFARGGFATDGPEFNMIQLFNGGAVAQSFTAAGLYPRGTATNCCGTLTALGTYLGGYIQIGHSNGSPSSGTIATVNNPLTIGDGNEQGTMYWEDTASGIPFGYVNVYDGLTYAGLPQNNKPVNVTGVVTSGGIGAGSPVPAWSNAAAYNPGDEVSELVLGTNQLYEALLAGTGHDPNTSPTFWALLGPAGGVNVLTQTAYNSIQTVGGMSAALGYTTGQALYPQGYSSSSSLNHPASGYGGFGYNSGSIYWYWNGTAWVSLDLSAIGGCGIANEVHYNNGSGSCTGSTNFQYDGTTENITVATTGAIAFQISEGAGTPVQMDGAGNISGFGVIASTGPSGGVNVTGDNAIKSIQTVGGLNIGSAGSNNGQIQWNGTTFINPNAALLNTTFKNINNNFQVNGNGTVSIVDVFNSTGSSGGVNVSASTNSRSIQTGLGGMYAGLGYTSDQAFYPLGYAASTSLIYPASGYGGFGYKSGSIYWYWNGTAWVSLDLSGSGSSASQTFYDTRDFSFSQSATISSGSNTITFTTCPKGVNSSNPSHEYYLSGGSGTELVTASGGTCNGLGTTGGTLTFSSVGSHTTIGTATAGAQEAIDYAVATGFQQPIVFPGEAIQFPGTLLITQPGITIWGTGGGGRNSAFLPTTLEATTNGQTMVSQTGSGSNLHLRGINFYANGHTGVTALYSVNIYTGSYEDLAFEGVNGFNCDRCQMFDIRNITSWDQSTSYFGSTTTSGFGYSAQLHIDGWIYRQSSPMTITGSLITFERVTTSTLHAFKTFGMNSSGTCATIANDTQGMVIDDMICLVPAVGIAITSSTVSGTTATPSWTTLSKVQVDQFSDTAIKASNSGCSSSCGSVLNINNAVLTGLSSVSQYILIPAGWNTVDIGDSTIGGTVGFNGNGIVLSGNNFNTRIHDNILSANTGYCAVCFQSGVSNNMLFTGNDVYGGGAAITNASTWNGNKVNGNSCQTDPGLLCVDFTNQLSFDNTIYTAPLGTALSQYKEIYYDSGTASSSYGMGVEPFNIGWNSAGGYKFYQGGGSTPILALGGAGSTTANFSGTIQSSQSGLTNTFSNSNGNFQVNGNGTVSSALAFNANGGAGSGFNVIANTAYNSIQTVGGVLASGVLATGLVGFPGSGSAPGVYLNSSSGTYNFVIGQGQAGLELAGQDSTGTIKSSLLLGSASIATGVAVLNSTNSFIISSPTTTLTSHLYPSNYSGSTSVSGGSSSLCSGANTDMSGCFIAIGPAVVTVTFGSAWGQAPHCVVSSSAGGSNTPYINGPPGTSSFGVGVVSLSSTYYWYHCM